MKKSLFITISCIAFAFTVNSCGVFKSYVAEFYRIVFRRKPCRCEKTVW